MHWSTAMVSGDRKGRVYEEDLEAAAQVFDLPMGNDVAPRREFLVASASRVDRDSIDA